MAMKVILFACMFPVAVIIYFVMRNEAKPKKNIVLGVTLPLEARQGGAVQGVVKRYLRRQNAVFAGLALALLAEFFLRRESVALMWCVVWMLFAVTAPFVPFAAANKRLRAMKAENGWYGEASGLRLVDLKAAAASKRAPAGWLFMPAAAASLLPLVCTAISARGRDEFWPMVALYASLFSVAALCYLFYRAACRQRSETVGADSGINAVLTQVRRYNWARCWLFTAYLTAAYAVAVWLGEASAGFILASSAIYSAALLLFLMRAEFKTRKVQQKLTEESGRETYSDEDDYWIFGLVYCNPNDSHFLVGNRTGLGMTVNVAKAPGKILVAFSLAALLAMPAVGAWVMHEEFTPVSLFADGTKIVARHTYAVYEIPFGEIKGARLIEKLPRGKRTNGAALETVLKGSFRLDGIGDCRLCLNPEAPPFIVVEAAGRTYILGGKAPEETLAVYAALQKRGVAAGR